MPSNFVGFDVNEDDGSNRLTPLAGQTVSVYDATNAVALTDVVADGSGHVASGTVATNVGNVVRFYFVLSNGKVASLEQVTT